MKEMSFKWEEDLMRLPSVLAGRGVYQNKFHEFDVYDHTIEVVNHARSIDKNPNLIASAWLHDIGKPAVATPMPPSDPPVCDTKGHPYFLFRGHDVVGASIIRQMEPSFFKQKELSQDLIALIVGNHTQPVKTLKSLREYLNNWNSYERNCSNYMKSLNQSGEIGKMTRYLFLSDILGQRSFNNIKIGEDEGLMFHEILSKNSISSKIIRRLFELQNEVYGSKED